MVLPFLFRCLRAASSRDISFAGSREMVLSPSSLFWFSPPGLYDDFRFPGAQGIFSIDPRPALTAGTRPPAASHKVWKAPPLSLF